MAGVIWAGECGDSGLELSVDGDIASSTKFSSNCSFTLAGKFKEEFIFLKLMKFWLCFDGLWKT